jgi:hypothetical protein
MIIGLSGYARSGKDTVANVLINQYGFERVAFADPIRDMLVFVNPILENGSRLNEELRDIGWENLKLRSEVRRLLQELGMAGREIMGNDIWIISFLKKLEDPNVHYVVTDVRFENEAVMIKQLGGQLWRIERESVGPVNGHVSELELNTWDFDRVIHNNSTIDSLELAVKTRMAMLIA